MKLSTKLLILACLLCMWSGISHAQQVSSLDVLPNTGTPDSTAVLNNTLRQNQNAINAIGGYFSASGALGVGNGGTGATTSQTALNNIIGTSVQGDILYFDGTNWSRLGYGTSGQVLETLGASANPAWFTLPSSPYASGTVIETYSMPVVLSTTSTSYQKLKELTPMLRSGVVSVAFDYESNTNATTHARIYVNGLAVGTDRSDSSGSFSTYTEDITVVKGDLLQIYGAGNPASSQKAVVCNMKVMVTIPTIPQDSTNPLGKTYRGAGIPNPSTCSGASACNQVGDQGDNYFRTDGSTSTTLYVKTGSSTWTAK